MKTNVYFLDENNRLRFAKPTTPSEQLVYVAQICGERDAAAANLLGIQLQNFDVASIFKGREVITPIVGILGVSREAVRSTKVRINRKAYEAVLAAGEGGKSRGFAHAFERRDPYFT